MKTEALAGAASAAVQPVIWTVLGYQFEAASMIAGLWACFMVRVWVSLNNRTARAWTADVLVTGIAMLFTAGWIVMQRPEPFPAAMIGTGFGALGAGIIAIALGWVKRMLPDDLEDDHERPRPDAVKSFETTLRPLYDRPLDDEAGPQG